MNRDRSKEADTCDEFVQCAYQDYSVNSVADLLLPTGFLIDRATQYIGRLERYVFLQGNTSEVYTRPEIDFIDSVKNIFVFKDFFKKTRKSMMPCRIVVARIDHLDAVSAGIALTKIINKAMDGLNVCLIISGEGLLFTGRVFDQRIDNDHFLSNLIKTKEHYDELAFELMFASSYNGFIEYYSYIRSVLQYKDDTRDYTDRFRMTHSTPYSYIEELQKLERMLHISFAKEIERSFLAYEESTELTYAERVEECKEYLFKIESSRVNTMEMLFEAEEMERLASEAETLNSEMFQQNAKEQGTNVDTLDAETKALLNDPENMIKILKKKRGR